MSTERKHNILASAAVVTALAVPSLAALADSAPDVTQRSATAIERDYGRAGADTYWEYREPGNVPGPVVKAYEEVKKLATEPPAVWPPQLQRYGRAGDDAGLEQLQAQPSHE